jgi:hypothetical protein
MNNDEKIEHTYFTTKISRRVALMYPQRRTFYTPVLKRDVLWYSDVSFHLKPWNILFITCLPPHTCFCWLYSLEGMAIHNVISKNYHEWYHIDIKDWLIIYCFTSHSRIFHLYEGLQNLGLCLVLRAFEKGGIFIVPHLLQHGTSVFPVSSRGLPHSVASNDTQGMWRIYSIPDPHGPWY